MSNFVQIKQRHLNKHERTSCFSNSQEIVDMYSNTEDEWREQKTSFYK